MSSASAQPQLPALTGIRFVAALHVVLFHCSGWAKSSWPAPLRNLVGAGYTAVGLFFVLSGFILTYTYRPDRSRRAFYAGRAARIYPVYLLGLFLAAPFFVWKHVREGSYGSLLAYGGAVAGLLQAYAPSLAMAWNPPAWSLSAEATFYALFPFLAPHVLRARRATAVAVGLAAWAMSLAFPMAYLALRPDGVATPTYETAGLSIDVLKYNPLVRLPEFVVGIVVGKLFLEARPWAERHAAWLSLATLAAIVLILAMSPLVPYPLLHNGLLVPFFAVLVLTLATSEGPLAGARRAPSVRSRRVELRALHSAYPGSHPGAPRVRSGVRPCFSRHRRLYGALSWCWSCSRQWPATTRSKCPFATAFAPLFPERAPQRTPCQGRSGLVRAAKRRLASRGSLRYRNGHVRDRHPALPQVARRSAAACRQPPRLLGRAEGARAAPRFWPPRATPGRDAAAARAR